MLRRRLETVGILGIGAVAVYVGATLLGGILDPRYSHLANAISELTGSAAANAAVLAPLYVAYNLFLVAFGYALYRAFPGQRLFGAAVVLFVLGGLSGIGQVTVFRMDSVGASTTTAGTGHLVLAGMSSLLTLVTAILYGVAFRRVVVLRRLSRYSFATAALLVMSAPLAVGTIGTELVGLFERITIGFFLLWVVVVSVYCLRAARGRAQLDMPVTPRAGHGARA